MSEAPQRTKSSSNSSRRNSHASASATDPTSARPKLQATSPIPLGAWRFKPGIQPEYKDGLWVVLRSQWTANDVTPAKKEEHRDDLIHQWRARNLIPGQWFIASIIPYEMFEKSGALAVESGHQIAERMEDGKIRSLLSKDRFEIIKDPAIVKLNLGNDKQRSEKGPTVILDVYALKDWTRAKGRYINQGEKPEPQPVRKRRGSSTKAPQPPLGWVTGLFGQRE